MEQMIHLNEKEKVKLWTKSFWNQTLAMVISILIWVLIGQIICNFAGWFTDPTDASGWKRSGLSYYVDHGTGVEYVGTRHGGLIVRQEGGCDAP